MLVPELDPDVLTDCEEDGPLDVAPAVTPCEAGTRYAVAAIVAVICGKPVGPAPRLIASKDSSRPLTVTLLFLTTTNRWIRPRKLERWKKLPRKVNVNDSIGKPAGPTVAPGGSDAVTAWVVDAGTAVRATAARAAHVERPEVDPVVRGGVLELQDHRRHVVVGRYRLTEPRHPRVARGKRGLGRKPRLNLLLSGLKLGLGDLQLVAEL